MIRNDGHDGAHLRDISRAAGIPIGCAVDVDVLRQSERYREVVRREFNMCVAENHFKAPWVWTGPETYDFSSTDYLADFAIKNDILLRGHALIWHSAIPSWLENGSFSKEEVRELLKRYIQALVGRYRGVVSTWDVVNEAIDDEGSCPWRDTFWLNTLGRGYIADAFRWAHEADPTAKLYYNDYEAEDLGPKSNSVYSLVRELLDDTVPIHGVGYQYHLIAGWRAGQHNRDCIQRIVDLGLEWQVTECDIRIQLEDADDVSEKRDAQAEGYWDVARLCRTLPRCEGLVMWGFTDAYSWIPGFRKGWGEALIFDEAYAPKPAYFALRSALCDHSVRSVAICI